MVCSVWVALSAEHTVELGLWRGETAVTPGFFGNGSAQHTASATTKRIGAKLHLALVTLDLTATPLIPGQLYAYNLAFSGGGANEDLNSLALRDDAGPPAERTHLALGYVPGQLPTFALPPIYLYLIIFITLQP